MTSASTPLLLLLWWMIAYQTRPVVHVPPCSPLLPLSLFLEV
uniref:Uncharacterized protein n=1 Tax=Amphimedon queenslandica TaxID=400682 RepID=A0A1X7SNQ1_AMPQE